MIIRLSILANLDRANCNLPSGAWPLFLQHLENLSREILQDYKDLIREYVKHKHGAGGSFLLFRRWVFENKMYLARNFRNYFVSSLFPAPLG